MPSINEVNLKVNDQIVTPRVLVDSVVTSDGTKLIDKLNIWSRNIRPNYWQKGSSSPYQEGFCFSDDGTRGICFKLDAIAYYDYSNPVHDVSDFSYYIPSTLNGYTIPEGDPDDNGFNACCYGNGKFIVVGDRNILVSTDGGKTFNVSFNTSKGYYTFLRVSYQNNMFIATGRRFLIYTSSDGINWTKISQSTFNNIQYGDVAYGNNVYVLAAITGSVYCTTDLSNIGDPVLTLSDSGMTSVCFGNGKFVAIGPNNTYYSTNGSSWTASPNASLLASRGCSIVRYVNNIFIAGSDYPDTNSSLMYSSDGINWVTPTINGRVEPWNHNSYLSGTSGIGYMNGKYIVTFSRNYYSYYSQVAFPN